VRALIVEDDDTTRLLLNAILSRYAQCDTVQNGTQALEAYQKAVQAGQPYELITLDLVLPDLEGLEVLRRVRALEGERKVPSSDIVRVLIVTGAREDPGAEHEFRSGSEAWLLKPLRERSLVEKLAELGLLAPS
jgi:two-component system, chemotaxis family, chemotaxis protein CheY